MRKIDRDLDRILHLLRAHIRERGFTQLQVQEIFGWGRSYVSQLLNGQKSLRVEHVLMILKVIGVKPEAFFGELYQFGEPGRRPRRTGRPAPSPTDGVDPAQVRRLRQLLDGLVHSLESKNLITAAELARAIEKAERGQSPAAGGAGEPKWSP